VNSGSASATGCERPVPKPRSAASTAKTTSRTGARPRRYVRSATGRSPAGRRPGDARRRRARASRSRRRQAVHSEEHVPDAFLAGGREADAARRIAATVQPVAAQRGLDAPSCGQLHAGVEHDRVLAHDRADDAGSPRRSVLRRVGQGPRGREPRPDSHVVPAWLGRTGLQSTEHRFDFDRHWLRVARARVCRSARARS
jgi:hypothetical protein